MLREGSKIGVYFKIRYAFILFGRDFYINDCSVNDTGVLIRLKSKNMNVNALIATRYQIITMAHMNVLYKIFRFLERIHQLS